MDAFPEGLIISVSGIRGRVGIELTPEVVARFAAAFGAFARGRGWPRAVALARDSRPSGPGFAAAAEAGLRAAGADVVDLGLLPTPTALLEIQEAGLGGGIVITASHNPREWNALKLAGPGGGTLTPGEGGELIDGLRSGQLPTYAAWDAFGGREERTGAVGRHIDRILELDLVEPGRIRERGLRVALDCTRGAGGVILPDLLERLGCDLVGIELEPDGRFTREPEPVPENLEALSELVRREGADLGFAVDPDADRLALVDGDGRAIGEDFTLALAARLVLAHGVGPVVANLSTSQIVGLVCERAGAPFLRAPVGEANVAEVMRDVNAVVGGEGNGGVILPALHYTRDAPLAVALILQLLAETGARLGDLVADYPDFRIIKDRVPRPELETDRLLDEIRSALPAGDEDRRDGLHLSWPDRGLWLHVRPSGTEPILRLIAEGPAESESEIRHLLEVARAAIPAGG